METPKISTQMENSHLYVSHKKVRRIPMTRIEYNIYRGWTLPGDENGADDGYLVEYMDGGKGNHPHHDGYISWSPKKQFDDGYTKVLEDYQQRVIEEKQELETKIRKLRAFLNANSAMQDCTNLIAQLKSMSAYAAILDERIISF